MSLFVNTNVSSLNAQRQLVSSSNALDVAFERVSSGFRINRAADDSAGLQISTRLTSQVLGLNLAVRNANDGISLSQTADGALEEVTNTLQRIRVLAIQSQDGIHSVTDRSALQQEVTELQLEISRIAQVTAFGGITILTGDYSAQFLVGANVAQTISINLSTANGVSFGASGLGVGPEFLSINTEEAASGALVAIDAAISTIGGVRADLGALQNRFVSTIRNLSNIAENLSSARSRIRDTDYAVETAELTRNQIIEQASVSVLTQATQRPQAALTLLG